MLWMRNVLKEETIHTVKVMAGPIMKTIMVGFLLNGEIIGLGKNGKMNALMVCNRKNGEMIGAINRLIITIFVMIMKVGKISIRNGEMMGGMFKVLGAIVMATGFIMKLLKTGILSKTKMEAATGKMA